MLSYAVTFLLVAILAALFGFLALAGFAASLAQILSVVFVGFSLMSMLRARRSHRQ